jgi:hypothetical protein
MSCISYAQASGGHPRSRPGSRKRYRTSFVMREMRQALPDHVIMGVKAPRVGDIQ